MAARNLRRALLALLAFALVGGGALGAAAGSGDPPTTQAARIEDELDGVRADIAAAQQRLDEAVAAKEALAAERARLSERQQALAAQLAAAQRDAQQLAVSLYIAGGRPGALELLGGADVADVAWRESMVETHATRTGEAAHEYQTLLKQADDDVRAAASRAAEVDSRIATATRDIADGNDRANELERQLRIARAREIAPASAAPDDAWARLRMCESSGNYRAVDRSGVYRGAYQFDLRTWQAMGGIGDPVDAPPEEQDLRARMLYAQRGPAPWPVCGRFLRALS